MPGVAPRELGAVAWSGLLSTCEQTRCGERAGAGGDAWGDLGSCENPTACTPVFYRRSLRSRGRRHGRAEAWRRVRRALLLRSALQPHFLAREGEEAVQSCAGAAWLWWPVPAMQLLREELTQRGAWVGVFSPHVRAPPPPDRNRRALFLLGFMDTYAPS